MSAASQVAGGQIVGARDRQEDAFAVVNLGGPSDGLLLVVADGMGGHVGGDVAAKLAIRAFVASLRSAGPAPQTKLDRALEAANESLRRAIEAKAALEGMGCTLVAAVLSANRLRWISVGDSGLFLLRDGKLSRLNADHSMRAVLADLVTSGRMSAEDAARDPTRSALRSAVSGDTIAMVDAPADDFILQKGDVILLASDGVEVLSDAEIARSATNSMAKGGKAVVDDLLRTVAAKKYIHQDNATAVACVFNSDGRAQAGRASPGSGRWLVLAAAVVLAALAAWSAWLWLGSPQASTLHAPHSAGSTSTHARSGTHAKPAQP